MTGPASVPAELDLNWTDLKSTPVEGMEYMRGIEHEKFRATHLANYEAYDPDPGTLARITRYLDTHDEALTILVMAASWCPDCQRHLPALVKVSHTLSDRRFTVHVLGGIKTRPMDKRKGGGYVWAVPPSPPEAQDPQFDLQKIPTFYIFGADGSLAGRIIEEPTQADTIEGEVLYHL